jgi:hypothetical protein
VRQFVRNGDAPPDSWVYRENWLVWHRAMLPPTMLEKEIKKVVAGATGRGAKPWAWESLRRLYNDFRESADDPVPVALQAWVDDVVNERVKRPTRPGKEPDSALHSRYDIAFTVLTKLLKFSKKDAVWIISEAADELEETVRSFLRRS